MESKYIQWLGTGPIKFELPSRGRVYTFKPKIRNKVDADVWDELRDPVSGPARVYVERKMLRPTTPGAGADVQESAGVSRAIAPAPPPPAPSNDPELREENKRLKAEIARLASRLAQLDEGKVEQEIRVGPKAKPSPEPKLEVAAPRTSIEPEPSGVDESAGVDPSSMSVDALEQAIKGLSLDDLEPILDAERAGKHRKGALAAIEAEQERALERQES